MKACFERWYPYVLGAIAALLWFRLDFSLPSEDSVLSSTLTVSSIFIGFLSTSKAILLSLTSQVLNDIKQTEYIDDLVMYIGHAIWLNLAFCVANVVGFFIDLTAAYYGILWICLAIAALTSFIRVTDIMLTIFRYS